MSQRTSFSSDHLPSHLTDHERAAAWYEIMNSGGYSIDYFPDQDRPFWCGLSTMDVGRVSLARSSGTTAYAERTKRHAAIDGSGNPAANLLDPIRCAEEMAMVDNISRGRIIYRHKAGGPAGPPQ